eukprot:1021945-Rhodomonas_salina.1
MAASGQLLGHAHGGVWIVVDTHELLVGGHQDSELDGWTQAVWIRRAGSEDHSNAFRLEPIECAGQLALVRQPDDRGRHSAIACP